MERPKGAFVTTARRAFRRSAPSPLGSRSLHRDKTKNRRSRTRECIPIPALKTSLILTASCSMRERFLGAVPKWTERELADRGGAGTWSLGCWKLIWKIAPGAPRPSHWRSQNLDPGWELIRLKTAGAPALQRTASQARSRGLIRQHSAHCAARMRGCGCLKFESDDEDGGRYVTPPSPPPPAA